MFKILVLAGLYAGLIENVPVVMNVVAFVIGLLTMFLWMALWGQQPTSVGPIHPAQMMCWELPTDALIIGALVWSGNVFVALSYVALMLGREGLRHAALQKALKEAEAGP